MLDSRWREGIIRKDQALRSFVDKKILVIDDDLDILFGLTMILEDEGYSVISTGDVRVIIPMLLQDQPDLILMDVVLPGADGCVITRELKAQDSFKDMPIILISSRTGAAEQAKQAGATDFVAKPLDISDLLQRISLAVQA